PSSSLVFFFYDTSSSHIYTLSLHDALPISHFFKIYNFPFFVLFLRLKQNYCNADFVWCSNGSRVNSLPLQVLLLTPATFLEVNIDRKSTRLNSSHVSISYAVFCLKKKTEQYPVLNQKINGHPLVYLDS